MSFAYHLATSGLTEEDARKLHWSDLSHRQVLNLTGHDSAGLLIPYFNLSGRRIKEMWRLRLYSVNQAKLDAWGAKQRGRPKVIRYTQPEGVRPYAYLPPIAPKYWKDVAQSDAPIFITEGEKKAAKLCLSGFPCVGLGGVHNFQSRDRGIDFLPELQAMNWKREALIAYDSDCIKNKDIRKAVATLKGCLVQRGAHVKQIFIPPNGDEKVGIDDFLVAFGIEAFEKLIEEAQDLSPQDSEMEDYYQRYVQITHPRRPWDG